MARAPAMKRIIFFHIGRTGGTTMRREILYKCVDPAAIFLLKGSEPPVRSGTVEDLLNMSRKEQEKLRVIVGHMPFGLRDQLSCPESWHYVTLLRDPVARTVSDYFQNRSSIDHPRHALAMQYSLEEFVRWRCGMSWNGILSWNGICRWLATEMSGRKFESPEAMYTQALRNAEAFSFIGLTEHFDESVRRLCRLCGWSVPKYEPQYGLTPKGHTLSDSERETLRAATLLDQKLYDHFRERFLQQPMAKASIRSLLLNNLLRLWPRRRRNTIA